LIIVIAYIKQKKLWVMNIIVIMFCNGFRCYATRRFGFYSVIWKLIKDVNCFSDSWSAECSELGDLDAFGSCDCKVLEGVQICRPCLVLPYVICQSASYIVGVAGWEVTWLVLHIQLIEHSGSSSSTLEPLRYEITCSCS
jgi:hypothetical protein